MFAGLIILGLPSYIANEYTYSVPQHLESRIKVGLRVKVKFNNRSCTGIVKSLVDKVDFDTKEIISLIDDKPLVTEELFRLAEWMSSFYISSLSEVFRLMLPSEKSPGRTRNFKEYEEFKGQKYELKEQQKTAAGEICSAIDGKKAENIYLKGVTGSGKTDVYLTCAVHATEDGGQILYLVPEISLTVQLFNSVLRYFKSDEIAVIHSYVSESAKTKAFMNIAEGKIKIVLGTRSAVFAPFKKLNLIIMDEEQDSSYKSDNSPHFLARHIAQKRAEYHNCVLLFGSATPSVECVHQIKEGKMRQLLLDRRIHEFKMPEIVVEKMNDSSAVISELLRKEISDTIDRGKQVVLFLNRRGYLYHYKCPVCGYEKMCDNCSVSMTYHRSKNMFVCHRCGKTAPAVRRCPQCGSENEMYSGYGTEYVSRIVSQLFPFARVLRLDADTVSGKGSYEKIITDFQDHEADILIGTQMISKGLNFPLCTLVGVLNATSSSVSSDFRSDEKLFSLLVQVAGRSGRFSDNGRVVIQCDDSAENVISKVKNQKDEEFYSEELVLRKKFALPPFTRIVRIVARSEKEETAKRMNTFIYDKIIECCRMLEKKGEPPLSVMAFGPCPIYRENRKYRMQTIIKSVSVRSLNYAVKSVKAAIDFRKKGFNVDFDMDADNFL